MAGSTYEPLQIFTKLLDAVKNDEETAGLRRKLESGWSVLGWGALGEATSRFLVGGFQVWVSLRTPANPSLKPEKGAGSFQLGISYTQREASACQEVEQASGFCEYAACF